VFNGREPLDISSCPNKEDVCGRDSISGEILFCGYHYNQLFKEMNYV